MSDPLRLVALQLGFAAVGAAVVLLAGIPRGRAWLPTIAGLAPAAGIAACGLAATLGAMVGIDVGVVTTGVLAILGLLATAVALRRRRPGIGSLAPPGGSLLGRGLELIVLAGLAVLSVAIVRLNAATALDAWDGWAMWGPKAHALFVEGDVWGPVFREPSYRMQHQEYPVLLPALEALTASAVGRFDPTLIDVQPAVVLVAFGWGAWAILRLVVPAAVAAAVALGLTASAPLVDNAADNYADAVVASFTALGLLCLLVWLVRGSSATLLLAGLFLAAAASTKAEGLLFALAAIGSAAVVGRGHGRSPRTALAFGAGVLVVPVAWMVVDRLNGPGARNVDRAALFDPAVVVDTVDRIPTAAWRLLEEIDDGWRLVSAAVLLAVLAACLVRLWWDAAFVILWGALAFAGLVGVYYASTAPVDWLLETSADRVVFSVVLGLGIMAPVLAGRAWEELTDASPPGTDGPGPRHQDPGTRADLGSSP